MSTLSAGAAAPARGAPDQLTPEIGSLDAEMRRLVSFLNDLIRHLNTIRPPVPRVFPFLDVAVIKGLEWQRGFADYRTRTVSGQPIITRLTLSWTLAGAGHFEVERDGVAIERMRARLFENRLRFAEEELRNARGLVERVRFQVFDEINARRLPPLAGPPRAGALRRVRQARSRQAEPLLRLRRARGARSAGLTRRSCKLARLERGGGEWPSPKAPSCGRRRRRAGKPRS